jgi:FkbM family methyltransferase
MQKKLHKLSLYASKLGLIPSLRIMWKMFLGKKGELISFNVPGLLHPVHIRAKTSDDYTFQQIFVNEEYAFQYNGNPHTIIDAGANIGLAAVYFANRFPGAKIICLEPESLNFQLLKKNTGSYTNIIALQKGLWNKPAHLIVEVDGRDNWGFIVKETSSAVNGSIEATSIAALLTEYKWDNISIAKIDIEGSEYEVLSEENSIEWMKKCDMLVIELHDRMRPGTSEVLFKRLLQMPAFSVDISGENLICDFSNPN